MAAAFAILGQIAKVLFCIIVIAFVSDSFSDFEVIIFSMLFFLYAYLYTFHLAATKQRNAQYYSLILALKEVPGIGRSASDFQQVFVEEMERNKKLFLIGQIGNMIVYFISLFFIAGVVFS